MAHSHKSKKCLKCKEYKPTKGGTYSNYRFFCKECVEDDKKEKERK